MTKNQKLRSPSPAETIIRDPQLTYQQKLHGLARMAERMVDVLEISPEVQELRDQGIICDLFEGAAPYRPRYIAPDYQRALNQGSEFMDLAPPEDIWEAVAFLQILYKHVPSITTFPVFLGNLDTLLEPFVLQSVKDTGSQRESEKAIRLLLQHIDRTLNDSFCHANLGPFATTAGELILKVTAEQKNAVPNLTLLYDPQITPDNFASLAAQVGLETAKPSFANHSQYLHEFESLGSPGYVIASCYNGLPLGGGSYTLVRLNLKKLADRSTDLEDFYHRLPNVVNHQLKYMDERVRFLVEESNFFQTSFLIHEGLISQDQFTGMFGIVGLAEAVNQLNPTRSLFGSDPAADQLGLEIISRISELVKSHKAPHVQIGDRAYLLHAQVGIDLDQGVSPGCRIPIGQEPPLPLHLIQSAPFHQFFPSGIGDVFAFEPTMKRNPSALVDIIKGAFSQGLRYLSAYSADSDVVRITGYLVKRSEIEKLNRGEPSLLDTTVLGKNAVNNLRVLDRKLRESSDL
jgi:YjjI family glycine radical enzyme